MLHKPSLLRFAILALTYLSTAALAPSVFGQSKTYANSENNAAGLSITTNGSLLTVNSTDTATQSGIISGGGTWTKEGSGTLTLSGPNTYSNAIGIEAGTLIWAHDSAAGATGSSPNGTTVGENGTLSLSNNISVGNEFINNLGLVTNLSGNNSLSGTITGTGGLNVTAGALTLSGDNNYTGDTLVSGGSLAFTNRNAFYNGTIDATNAAKFTVRSGAVVLFVLGDSGYFSSSDLNTIANNATFDAGSYLNTYTTQIGATTFDYSGSYNFNKLGIGTFTLDAASTGTGTIAVDAGTLIIDDLNSGTLSAASIINYATLQFTHANALAFAGDLSGAGAINKTGAGTLTFTGSDTGTGDLTLSNGTLSLIIPSGDVVDNSRNITVDGANLTFDTTGESYFQFFGDNGSGSLTIVNGGTVTHTFSSPGGAIGFDGDSGSSTGSITGPGSSLTSEGEFITNNGSLTISDGGTATFNYNGTNEDFFSFIGGYSGDVGTVSVTGTDSALSIADRLLIGDYGGTGTLTIGNGGTVSIAQGVELGTYYASSTGTLNLNDGGTLILGNDSNTGLESGPGNESNTALESGPGTANFNLAGGTLKSNGTHYLIVTSDATLVDGTTSTIDTNGIAGGLTGVLSGSGNLIKAGTGMLGLSGDNTFTGTTTIDAGTLTLYHANALQGSTLTTTTGLSFGDLIEATLGGLSGSQDLALTNSFDEAVALTIGANNTNTLYAGDLSGAGSLIKTGTANLSLTGDNTYTGGTTVSAGGLFIGAGDDAGSLAGNISNQGTVTFNRSDDHTYSGVVSGTGDLVHDGNVLRFSSAQTYTGDTSIKSGAYLVLANSIDQGLSASTRVNIESTGYFDLSNHATTVAALTGAGNVYSFGGSSGHLTVNTAIGQSQSFSGVLGSDHPNFAFTKSGDGTLTLSGANTYTGATTVSAGTLRVDGSLASTSVSVDNGAILSGSGSITGTVAIHDGGTIAPGNSPGTLSTGTMTFEGGGLYAFEINDAEGTAGNATGWDHIEVTGNLTIAASDENPFTIEITSLTAENEYGFISNFDETETYAWSIAFASSGISGFGSDSFILDTSNFQNDLKGGHFGIRENGNLLELTYTAVPEPSTWVMILGMFALGYTWKRRRSIKGN